MGDAISTAFIRGMIDKWPLADDTYWLGSSDKGWKGVYFPDLKLYQLDANSLSIENAAGGTYKNLYLAALKSSGDIVLYPNSQTDLSLSIQADGTKTTLLPATGDYLRIGDAGTATYCTSNDDLYVSGQLETSGLLYAKQSIFVQGSYIQLAVAAGAFYSGPANTDSCYMTFQGRDNGVGWKETARIQGAADPYFQIGRDDTGVATNAVTDMLVLQMGAGTNNEAANFGFGLVVKLGNAASEVEERCSIDFVLTNAGNGTEATEINFNVMTGGGMVERASIDAKGITFASSVVSSSGVDEVSIGGYDVAVGSRTLAVSTEATVVAATTQAFSGYIPVCWNGATVRIAFCTT